ncbi:hypothetical protein IE4872_CH01072 [Rhizobium gallicum]|uniref:Uncharacterized protein n=1 Tax=Rhizobium gallicum TaxID=56730 RepID=A0A1L5NFN9_9HYPH|nr:hypothetical protein IE4872_CH01072 [Rhizobium gallicum]
MTFFGQLPSSRRQSPASRSPTAGTTILPRSGARHRDHLKSQPRQSDDLKNGRTEIARAQGDRKRAEARVSCLSGRIIWGVIVDERPEIRIAVAAIQRQVDDEA